MKIEATTIEEFFEQSGKHREVLTVLDNLMMELAPKIDRKLYVTDTLCMIGYGAVPYQPNDSFGGVWPMISIAPQKHTANLYIMGPPVDGKYLSEHYEGKLGNVTMGKSCIRIKKIEDVNLGELENLLKQGIALYSKTIKK
jgi:hypothetical protein